MSFVLVQKIKLGDQCFPNDICNDPNAECKNGVCACSLRSVLKNGMCGK